MNYTNQSQLENCPSCGAPVTSEICPYCGTPTGLDTAKADMEYPVIECKEANLNFLNVCFPGIFALSFGLGGIITIVVSASAGEWPTALLGIPFLMIGVASGYFAIRAISRYMKVKTKGKQIKATVYGYMDDTMLINDVPAQVVKLLVQTPNGPRFIMYQLGDTKQIYGVNTQINLTVYENYFLISNKQKETVDWG